MKDNILNKKVLKLIAICCGVGLFTIFIFYVIYCFQNKKEFCNFNISLSKDNVTRLSRNQISKFDFFFKPEVIKIKDSLGEEFDQALFYFDNIKNVELDWTLALPIFGPPLSVKKAGSVSFLMDDLNHYTSHNGDPKLRDAIKKKLEKDGIKLKEKNIVVSTSIFEILKDLYSILNWTPKHSILIPVPAFGQHPYQAVHCNMKVHFLNVTQESGWKITPEDLDKTLTLTKPTMFLFTNPVNPTGVVYNKEEVEKLAAILKKHQILVISDEIFKDVLLDKNQQPFSIGAVEGMENLTITLSGLGKSMGLVGLRLSYGCIPDWLIGKLPEPSSGISKPVEKAAIYALQDNFENQEYLQMSMRGYNKRLKIIKEFVINMDRELNKKFNIDIFNAGFFIKLYIEPKATNVVLVSFQGLKGKYSDKKQINSSVDLAFYILEKTGIALTPGEVFLIKGEKMVLRIPLAAQNLDLGLERIRKALLELKTKESY